MKRAKKKCGCGFADYLYKHKRISKSKHDSMCKKAKAKCERSKGRRKSRSVNPWAVCSSQGLKRGTAKYERCVRHVKRSR